MPAPASSLKLEHVSKSFVTAPGVAPLTILRDINFEIAPGQAMAIIGPSGSGKSTLLNLLGTLDRPDAGKIWLDGEDVSQFDEARLALTRNRKIGFVFQSHFLLPQCSVLENVLVPTLADSDASLQKKASDRAKKLLQRVGLGERLGHRPGQLSGGERQRVAVVRALINQPRIVLADEPTGALDRVAAGELAALLLELNREENTALVVVTHAVDLARQMSQVFELRDGQLFKTA